MIDSHAIAGVREHIPTPMNPLRVLCFALFLTAPLAPGAELRLATLFGDHMVLQRDKPLPVWGWSDPGEALTLEFAGQSKSLKANPDGKWAANLEPLEASAEARTLVVRSTTGNRKVEVQDVLVGEVWLGSGQSNMAMSVSRALRFDEEQAAAALPAIRMFKETSSANEQLQEQGSGAWAVCSPETVGEFSATLFFFGRELHRELKIPVGLINSSVGGTPIEAWTALDAQRSVPELKEFVDASLTNWAAFDAASATAAHEKSLATYAARVEKAKSQGTPLPRKPRDPLAARRSKGNLGGLFNAKIAPLIPYALRGAVWYQGEANSHPGKGQLYQYQLPLLVSDWRHRWGEAFPFAWVQLPNYGRATADWCLVRDAMQSSLKLPGTGMAITIDVGDPADIHPKNKQEVGRRLSLWALGAVYGKSVPATSGPLFSSHEIRGSEVVLNFTHTEGGLKAGGEQPTGFFLAGEDRRWHPASARIAGNQILVSSADVPRPVAARYAWETNPQCDLRNGAGLPAAPFRTDSWPLDPAPPQ